MNRPTSPRRWFQFRLRSLLLLALLVAVGLGGWQYWRKTRQMWRLQWASRAAMSSSSEEARIWKALAWDEKAWHTGPIRELRVVPEYDGSWSQNVEIWDKWRAQLRWSACVRGELGGRYHVHLFETARPAEGPYHPLVCVVTDKQRRVETWKIVAGQSDEFKSATIDGTSPAIMRISCGGFTAQYHIQVTKTSIQSVAYPYGDR